MTHPTAAEFQPTPGIESMTQATTSPNGPRDMLCIVLSFNGYADTAACLDSLRAVPVPGFDVLVIDNASKDGAPALLAANYPDVELIALEENLGWAGGNNVGIRLGLERGYRWICLLNNDTVFPAGQVQAWLDAARAMQPCLLHPTIHYWDEPEVAQLHPGFDDSRAPFEPVAGSDGLIRMSYAYGACLAVHRTIFERVGLFDERFFLQLEETDFHHRAERAGFDPICTTKVKMFHKESRAFGGTRAAIKIYYTCRNTLLLIEKEPRWGSKLERLKRYYWTLNALSIETQPKERRHGFLRWMLSSAPAARAVRAGIADYVFRRFGKASDDFRAQLVNAEKSYAALRKADMR
jgi:GT2 family glycosyltransferase